MGNIDSSFAHVFQFGTFWPEYVSARGTRLVLSHDATNQYHTTGVFDRTRHCIEAAAAPSRRLESIAEKRDVIRKTGST